MKLLIAAFTLAVLAFVAPAAADDKLERLLNRMDTLGLEQEMGMTLKDHLSKKLDRRRRTRGVEGRELKKSKKSGKGKSGPDNCCEFLTELAELDLACYSIAVQAVTYTEIAAAGGEDFSCAEDVVPKSKGKGSSQTGGDLTGLAEDFEDASEDFDEFIEDFAEDFEGTATDCLAVTPSTYTFSCDSDYQEGSVLIDANAADYDESLEDLEVAFSTFPPTPTP